MLTHIVRHIFRMAKPTNFKFCVQMKDEDPHQPQAPRPPRSKVKVARSRDQSEPFWPNAVPVSLAAGGGIPCRRKPAATLLVKITSKCTNPCVSNTTCSSYSHLPGPRKL